MHFHCLKIGKDIEIFHNMFYKMTIVCVVFVGGKSYRVYGSSSERATAAYGACAHGNVSSGFA